MVASATPLRHRFSITTQAIMSALRDEWFAYRDRAYAALARDWLEGDGVESEWIDPRCRP